jgi:hypothetical protein
MQSQNLTQEKIDAICNSMRIIDFMQNHKDLLDENAGIKNDYAIISETLKQVIESLSKEQLDVVLETHRTNILKSKKTFDEIDKRNN